MVCVPCLKHSQLYLAPIASLPLRTSASHCLAHVHAQCWLWSQVIIDTRVSSRTSHVPSARPFLCSQQRPYLRTGRPHPARPTR